MVGLADYMKPPYTTSQLHTAGEDLWKRVATDCDETGGFPNISAELLHDICVHIQQPSVAAAGSVMAGASATATSTATAAAAAAVADVPIIEVPIKLPAADHPRWQRSITDGTSPRMIQYYLRVPHNTQKVSRGSKSSRNFEGWQAGSLRSGTGGWSLIVRRLAKPVANWQVLLFVACQAIEQQPGASSAAQLPHGGANLRQQQQQQNGIDGVAATHTEDDGDPLVPRLASHIDDTEFQNEVLLRCGQPAEPLGDLSSLSVAGVGSSAAAAADSAAGSGRVLQPDGPNNANSSEGFNPTHNTATALHKHGQFTADIEIGWLFMRYTGGPLEQRPANPSEQSDPTGPARKKPCTGPAVPVGTIAATAGAAMYDLGMADIIQRTQRFHLLSQRDAGSNYWTTERQLRLFNPVGTAADRIAEHHEQLQLPTDDSAKLQLQQAIDVEHRGERGVNSKGENVLHLIATTRTVPMDTRLKQLDLIAEFPLGAGLLSSLMRRKSERGNTPLMQAALGEARPQFTGPEGQGHEVYTCQPWQPEVYNKLLALTDVDTLQATNKKAWNVLHRLLHSAALYEKTGDHTTQKLLHQAYADTLHRCFVAAIENVAAGAVTRTVTEVAEQPVQQLLEVQLSSEPTQAAWQFMDVIRKHAERGRAAHSQGYLGDAQQEAADALYAALYPSDNPAAEIAVDCGCNVER